MKSIYTENRARLSNFLKNRNFTILLGTIIEGNITGKRPKKFVDKYPQATAGDDR